MPFSLSFFFRILFLPVRYMIGNIHMLYTVTGASTTRINRSLLGVRQISADRSMQFYHRWRDRKETLNMFTFLFFPVFLLMLLISLTNSFASNIYLMWSRDIKIVKLKFCFWLPFPEGSKLHSYVIK